MGREGVPALHVARLGPLPAAVGRAVLRTVVAEGLAARAAEIAARRGRGWRSSAAGIEAVGDVRGRGLLQGVDLVADRDTRAPDAPYGTAVTARRLELGLNVSIVKFAGSAAACCVRAAARSPPRTSTSKAGSSTGLPEEVRTRYALSSRRRRRRRKQRDDRHASTHGRPMVSKKSVMKRAK